MCLAVFHFDPDRAPGLVVYETRDQSVHLAHGCAAALRLGMEDNRSYDFFWREHPELLDRMWTFKAATDQGIRNAPVVGGLDQGGGSWLAVNEETGVYARLLVAPDATGTLGEAPTPADRSARARAGYVSRSGVVLDAVSFPDAETAAAAFATELPRALARDGVRLQAFFLLLGDSRSAWTVFHQDDDRPRVEPVAPGTHVLSVRGLDSTESALTDVLRARLADRPLPGTDQRSWDPWLEAFAAAPWLHDDPAGDTPHYAAPHWRAHRYSALQPPYLNTPDDTRHRRAEWPGTVDTGRVEWTKSTTCAAIGPQGLSLLMYDERHVDPGAPWPARVEDMAFPVTSADYTAWTPALR